MVVSFKALSQRAIFISLYVLTIAKSYVHVYMYTQLVPLLVLWCNVTVHLSLCYKLFYYCF